MKKKGIVLTGDEVMYLLNTDFLDDKMKEILHKAKYENETKIYVIEGVNKNIAECLREIFTARLAEVGFGVNYELTREGVLLESLIDKFFMPQ